MHEEQSYTCDVGVEEIVIPIDPSAGAHQKYVEDCPVCCAPNVIHVEMAEDGCVTLLGRKRSRTGGPPPFFGGGGVDD